MTRRPCESLGEPSQMLARLKRRGFRDAHKEFEAETVKAPQLSLARADGEVAHGRFGAHASLIFGATPPGPLARVAVRVECEFPIKTYRVGIIGSGALVVRGAAWIQQLSDDRRTIVWGDDYVQAGNYMKLEIHAKCTAPAETDPVRQR